MRKIVELNINIWLKILSNILNEDSYEQRFEENCLFS